ncbi:TPA: hypothetical protein ACTUXY_003082 [Legionella pneumophila]
MFKYSATLKVVSPQRLLYTSQPFKLLTVPQYLMSLLKNYLTSMNDLNQLFLDKVIATLPYKIGDYVKMVPQEFEAAWTIVDFSITADGEPAVLLENEENHTFALIKDIQFYYH